MGSDESSAGITGARFLERWPCKVQRIHTREHTTSQWSSADDSLALGTTVPAGTPDSPIFPMGELTRQRHQRIGPVVGANVSSVAVKRTEGSLLRPPGVLDNRYLNAASECDSATMTCPVCRPSALSGTVTTRRSARTVRPAWPAMLPSEQFAARVP